LFSTQEGEVSGRQCTDQEICFQIGSSVPVYGVEGFDKKQYNEASGLFDK
jgi:hypothetical protein